MIAENLQNAIASGASLRVRYFGGSTPGRERDIQPISVKDGKVRARCLLSDEIKTFIIEKIELVVDGEPSQLASILPQPIVTFQTVDVLTFFKTAALQALGWAVQREGENISLHRTLKNGKMIQKPDVSLRYEAIAYDLVFDGEQVRETNHRERSRPWIVSAKKQATKTYGDFGKAQTSFLEFAKSLSPLGPSHNT
ncbi:predicted transcriptional regulator [Serpentinimonas maccroryi]|uniref:Predicted transcriptional regulator n=1 Tax=Serpentinimonas maccroryi TaxID=1458426 RepID=A0A060NR96_9BURK|nr:WYL domain-containing protein [Serpentinimonas maccroryi]BAO84287.1 predicted transcriptional regulator [Serpentinimonas maccroryi]